MSDSYIAHRIARDALRYVEKQSRIATTALVDTVDEQHRLETLIEASKQRVPPEAQGLHWLLRSAFRYPPLPHGSRFGTAQEPGILYLSEDNTALTAELAFYAFQFYLGMSKPPPAPIRRSYTVIGVRVTSSHCAYADDAPDARALSAPASWARSQAWGRAMRDQGALVIRYRSARCATGQHYNLAVCAPAAVRGNAEPATVDSCTAVVDGSGVRIIGAWKPVEFHAAARLNQRPF